MKSHSVSKVSIIHVIYSQRNYVGIYENQLKSHKEMLFKLLNIFHVYAFDSRVNQNGRKCVQIL